MITFKQYLDEGSMSSNVTYDFHKLSNADLIKTVEGNCQIAISDYYKGSKIWRGTTKEVSGLAKPSTGTRSSANTSNWYTLLLDSNPLNTEFPKRAKSFIAASRNGTARGYGDNTMIVLPFDGTKIGSVNLNDIWNTRLVFPRLKGQDSIEGMNKFWTALFGRGVAYEMKEVQSRLRQLKKDDPTKVAELLADYMDAQYNASKPDSAPDIVQEFIDDIPDAYSYYNLGCTLDDRPSKVGLGEIWFSGDCVLVAADDLHLLDDHFKTLSAPNLPSKGQQTAHHQRG